MKKIILLCLVSILLLSGCVKSVNNEMDTTKKTESTTQKETTVEIETTTHVEENVSEAAIALRKVMRNEIPFLDADHDYKEVYRKSFDMFQDMQTFIAWGMYWQVDIDNLESNELNVMVYNSGNPDERLGNSDCAYELFRYYNGKVYGYQMYKIIFTYINNGYFGWNSFQIDVDLDNVLSGVGQITFDKEKIYYTYYVREDQIKEKEWLLNNIQGDNSKVVCDDDKYYEILKNAKNVDGSLVGEINSEKDIDRIIR